MYKKSKLEELQTALSDLKDMQATLIYKLTEALYTNQNKTIKENLEFQINEIKFFIELIEISIAKMPRALGHPFSND